MAPPLEVFEAAAPAALLETAQVAMRDLQRGLMEVLTDHRQLTTGVRVCPTC